MEPRVVGITGPLQGQTLSLPEGEVSIGREPSNQLWAADGSLSRRHCVFHRNGANVLLRDLGSRNGTRVNGVPVSEQSLQHGDEISVGLSLFIFLEDAYSEETHSNPVELEDTNSITGVAYLLPREESDFPLLPTKDEEVLGTVTPVRVRSDLNALLKIATAISSIRDRESLQWQLLGFIFDVIPGERGSVLFFDPKGEISSTTAWDRVRGPEHIVPINQAVLKKVITERSGLLVTGAASSPSPKRAASGPAENGSTSLLCVPMAVGERVTGVIYLDAKVPTVQFDANHLRVLQAIAHISALALENLNQWEKLQQENLSLRAEIGLKHDIVGGGPQIRKVFDFIRKVAPADSTVLIQGESGTGKELVARAIHSNSPRADHPFIAINSAAITASLLESELFGHEKGAFTGAVAQKKGKVELAEGGTLFLDEISELAPELQAKLLRVLQEREFERVGGTRSIPLNIRLIAATNKSLAQAVESGQFRKDLFYRLNVVAVTLPPLRDRREDIPEMAEYFLRKARSKCQTLAKSISPEAMVCLKQYDWPGNVRELENAMERAAVLGTNDLVRPDDLPESIVEGGNVPGESANYYNALKDFKKQLIQQALQQANGSYLEAAKTLGLHPNSLLRLMRNLNIKSASKGLSSTGAA
jgi:transcriptional regulator with GAF, ATPase, and Fis domain